MARSRVGGRQRPDVYKPGAWLGLAVAVASLSACSFRFDSDRPRCRADSDCQTLGVGLTCDQGLCVSSSACAGGACAQGDAESVLAEDSGETAVSADAGRTGDTFTAPMDAGGQSLQADGEADQAPPEAGPDSDDGGAADAGNPEIDTCSGPECEDSLECVSDQDCVDQGLWGGSCIGSVCWPSELACDGDADCLELGPEFEGGRCVMHQCVPNPQFRCEPVRAEEDQQAPVDFRVRVVDAILELPMSDVVIKVCSKLDPACDTPVVSARTDERGEIHATARGNLGGFLLAEVEGFFPAMYFLPPMLPADGLLQPFPLMPSLIIADFLAEATLNAGIDPDRGHMMLIAEDCFGDALPGVRFDSAHDESTLGFYVRDQLPSLTATETGEVGNGGYINYPSGPAEIDVTLAKNGLLLTDVSVAVRKGYISVAYLRPEFRRAR